MAEEEKGGSNGLWGVEGSGWCRWTAVRGGRTGGLNGGVTGSVREMEEAGGWKGSLSGGSG